MKTARLLSLLALLLTITPAILYAVGVLGGAAMKMTLLLGTVLWFLAAPRWLRGGTE